jgi:hypothetical protein
MRYLRGRSYALAASIAVAASMAGAALADAAKPHNQPSSTTIVVTNSRDVALTELDATPTGLFIPRKIASNIAPGKKATAVVNTEKECAFDLHGIYADGSNTDSTSVDLCKDKNVNLIN